MIVQRPEEHEVQPGRIEPVALSELSTVVARYEFKDSGEKTYQTEAQLEREFIELLQGQAYEYLDVTDEAGLLANLRRQLELLNETEFTDAQWNYLLKNHIASTNDSWETKTENLHESGGLFSLPEDPTSRSNKRGVNIKLLDKHNIHNNRLQVINQYEVAKGEGGARQSNRYDVTILVNGLPMVHIELKRRGVDIREAFNQIRRYERESFFAGSRLFDYVQLFVISNGTLTKYYSNSTRRRHVEQQSKGRRTKAANSYEFTSWWADAQNRRIDDLMAFGKTFFAKHTLLNILTKYSVFTSEKVLLVMRPYQIVACEKITNQIKIANNAKTWGKREAGGFVWHTTGSGKTLTSFKTAQLAMREPGVNRVLFVVDRQDLDYQTMREYDRFKKGAANSNNSMAILKAQLEDSSARIIITTIQKLYRFITANPKHPVFQEKVVIIFDECHRSQFGDMHNAITKNFKNYAIFGFTGTPIFDDPNSTSRKTVETTGSRFGRRLHTYTILDAINDKNVLPFRVDYVDTVQTGAIKDGQVKAIDREKALLAPERISKIVEYILKNYSLKTRRTESYDHSVVVNAVETTRKRNQEKAQTVRKNVRGFNSLFATSSVQAAMAYYEEFKRQQAHLPEEERLKIATIYSFAANEATTNLDEEGIDPSDVSKLDETSKEFLIRAIDDYNAMFKTNYSVDGDGFGNYYRHLSQQMKNREVDLVIVVNMFLTGFDATTMNTLWVDKNLRAHGLIQAYSRTNRILNSVKSFGNIVCFRDLQQETNDAIAMFSDSERSDAGRIIVLPPFEELYADYADLVSELLENFPLGEPIVGETAEKEFIRLYGRMLRARNLIESCDEFVGNEILNERDAQNYKSRYLDLYETWRGKDQADKEDIVDDLQFELTLIQQVEVNVDYILLLIQKYNEELANKDTSASDSTKDEIKRAINATPSLRNKRDLIDGFVDQVGIDVDVAEEWQSYVEEAFRDELGKVIDEESLHRENTFDFMVSGFRDGQLRVTGTRIGKVLPKVSRFATNGGNRIEKKARTIEKLTGIFERFKGLYVGRG